MIRIQCRCPSPAPYSEPRSGSLVLDIRSAQARSVSAGKVKSHVKFSAEDDQKIPLLAVDIDQIIISLSGPGEVSAVQLLDISSSMDTLMDSPNPGTHVTVCRSQSFSGFVINTKAKCISFDLSKSDLDGLQLWVDDVSRFISRSPSEASDCGTERGISRPPSLIGSRFFARNELKSAQGSFTKSGSDVMNEAQNQSNPSGIIIGLSSIKSKRYDFFDIRNLSECEHNLISKWHTRGRKRHDKLSLSQTI